MSVHWAVIILLTAMTQKVWPVSASRDTIFGPATFSMDLTDISYLAFSYYLSLVGRNFPTLDTTRESLVYHHLLNNALRPNSLLFSFGIYPLAITGAAIKAWAPHFYAQSKFLGSNLVRAITESANYRQPWSISLFFGHIFFFKEQGELTGQGSIGLLSSYGYWFIISNTIHQDHWGEFEAKLKVDKTSPGTQYSNSYRIGGLIHSNHDIRNTIYLSFKRDRTDWNEHGFSLIKNTILEARTDIGFNPLDIVLFSIAVGKKWRLRLFNHRIALGAALGVVWYFKNPYRGELANEFPIGAVPYISPRLNY